MDGIRHRKQEQVLWVTNSSISAGNSVIKMRTIEAVGIQGERHS
jgi:hypothetical protein